jgi:hypothetical protein
MEQDKKKLRVLSSQEQELSTERLENVIERLRNEVSRETAINIVPIVERLKQEYSPNIKSNDLKERIKEDLTLIYEGDKFVNEEMIDRALDNYLGSRFSIKKFYDKHNVGITAGIWAIVVLGMGAYFVTPLLRYEAYQIQRNATISKYADKNHDGIITKDEETAFWSDFAVKNNIVSIGSFVHRDTFFDKNGEEIDKEKLTEMLKNY